MPDFCQWACLTPFFFERILIPVRVPQRERHPWRFPVGSARIVVVRHALNANQSPKNGVSYDPPLCARGRDQAAKLARNIAFHLPTEGEVVIRHSRALRATETAEIIAKHFGATLFPDDHLADRPWSSSADTDAWLRAYSETLKKTLERHPSLVLVTHTSVMRMLFGHLPGVVGLSPPMDPAPPHQTLGPAHGFLVTRDIQAPVSISY